MIFRNKTVIITGGTSGIGLATAMKFLLLGTNTVVCGRNEGKGDAAVKQLAACGGEGKSVFIKCDVSSEDDVARMFSTVRNEFQKIDYAVNCAGISKKGKLIIDFTESDFEEVMNINVKGVFFCMREELRLMLQHNRGVIVNIASVLGVRANNSRNALYTVSKHALIGLTKEAALEYAAQGIRINAVLPAYTETEIIQDHLLDPEKRKALEKLHPIKRLIRPQEVADSILFLCSEQAAALTGVLLPVDGGCSIA